MARGGLGPQSKDILFSLKGKDKKQGLSAQGIPFKGNTHSSLNYSLPLLNSTSNKKVFKENNIKKIIQYFEYFNKSTSTQTRVPNPQQSVTLPPNNNNRTTHTNPNTNITPHTTPPTPPTTQHHNTSSPHNNNITISKTQILNRKHTTPTTQNNIHKIYTLKATNKQIEKYNNTRNHVKSKQQNRKNTNIHKFQHSTVNSAYEIAH